MVSKNYGVAPKSLSLFCLTLKEKGHPEVPLCSMRNGGLSGGLPGRAGLALEGGRPGAL
jgi:hypothetical protein